MTDSSMSAGSSPRRDLGRDPARGLHDVPAPAIGHGENQVIRVLRGPYADGGLGRAARSSGFRESRAPMNRSWMPLAWSSSTSRWSDFDEQPHQAVDLVGGTLPVLAAEGEQREHLDVGLDAGLPPSRGRGLRPPGDRRAAAWRGADAHRPLPSMMMATCRGTSCLRTGLATTRPCWE